MPDVVLGAPEETEYTYVLVHHGMPKNQRILIGVHDESKYSRLVPWPYGWPIPTGPNTHNGPKHEGDLATFAFVNSRHLFQRSKLLGWTDVTAEWRAFVARQHGRATEGDPSRLGDVIDTGEVQQESGERAPELDPAPKPTEAQEAPPAVEVQQPAAEPPAPAPAPAPAPEPAPAPAPQASPEGATGGTPPAKPPLRVVQTAEPLRRKPPGK